MLNVAFLCLFFNDGCISRVERTVEGLWLSPPVLLQAWTSHLPKKAAPRSSASCSPKPGISHSNREDPSC